MNLFKYFVCALIFISASYGQDCKAKLFLKADIPNSVYTVNNKIIGEGKEVSVDLSAGTYVINICEDGKTWSPLQLTDTVLINDCNDITREYKLLSLILLRSDPPDAYVYANDSLIGYTPLEINKSFSSLLLKKPGYKDYITGHDLSSVIKLERTSESNGKLFYERPLFKYLIGGLLVLGGTTAYYKLKADDFYDRYAITGNPEFLDKTDHYDTISGICFGALQINFGLLLYYFLSE